MCDEETTTGGEVGEVLLRACERCVVACGDLEAWGDRASVMKMEYSGRKLTLNQLSLTLAAIDRQLAEYCTNLCEQDCDNHHHHSRGREQQRQQRHASDPDDSSLRGAADRVRLVVARCRESRYMASPTGGIASLLFYLAQVLEDTSKWLVVSNATHHASWLEKFRRVAPQGLIALLALLLASRANRALRGVSPLSWRWRTRFAAAAVLFAWSRQRDKRRERRALRTCQEQLLVLMRLWVVVQSVVSQGKVRRTVSYTTLIAQPSVEDHVLELKPSARRILERVPLPSTAAFWYSRNWRLAMVKRGMDLLYAGVGLSSHLTRHCESVWLWRLAGLPLSLLAFIYYSFRPGSASHRASAELAVAQPLLVKHAWSFVSQPPMRVLSKAVARLRGLAFQRRWTIAGVACHVLAAEEAVFDDAVARGGSFIPSVIFFCHGGGFISNMHEADLPYLTSWALRTRSVIVAPDYTLCPNARFPTALNEIAAVYEKVMTGEGLGFVPRRVAVAGESAGGNLAAALCLRTIQRNYCPEEGSPTAARVPDCCLMGYPVLNLSLAPSPSRAVHMHDPILPLGILTLVRRAYIPPGLDISKEPCASPAHADDSLLRHFPTTFLLAGGLDPLLDDAIDFHERLCRVHSQSRLKVFRSLPHGFFGFSPLIHEAAEAMHSAETWLEQELTYSDAAAAAAAN